ncbi:MAG: hypothetical protein HY711_06590, partial [Candidatus Melainabacteria bacterium]|nr:hypothetical protein [Candidatus Melainabacteria bacterium]
MLTHSSASKEQLKTPSHATNEHLLDLACILALGTMVLIFFSKTVFWGQSISKINFLCEWDSLFQANSTGATRAMDPSVIELLIPMYFLVAKQWCSNIIPLWNSYSGFGCPLVGDIQATVFSPFRFFFNLHPTMYMYNLSLVLEIITAAISTFLLARLLGLRYYAAVFASLIYALCPFNLWYLELLSGPVNSLFPLLVWLFTRAAYNPTFWRFVIAGGGVGVVILSGHPESAFFSIAFASLLYFTISTQLAV